MERYVYIVFNIHSGVRWLVLLTGVAASLKFTWGWMRGNEFKNLDRLLAAIFSGLFDLQVTLGFIFFWWSGFTSDGFHAFRVEHALAMGLALTAAHLPARWRNADDNIRFRNSLFAILASFAFILLGISRLPGGLSR
jgi:hypothetical protein